MQLREEIKSNYGVHECPVNDWMCKYFDNGSCILDNPQTKCTSWVNKDVSKKKN